MSGVPPERLASYLVASPMSTPKERAEWRGLWHQGHYETLRDVDAFMGTLRELEAAEQMRAAAEYREKLLQDGGAKLRERVTLADELAEGLITYHGQPGHCRHPEGCIACSALSRHAALRDEAKP